VNAKFNVFKQTFYYQGIEFPYFEINLPEGKQDFKIAQLTDQHLPAGSFLSKKELNRFKAPFKELGIDLIVNTGDLFCRNANWLVRWVLRTFDRFFKNIAPWTFAWGNHDTENFDRKGRCKRKEDPLVDLEKYIASLPNSMFIPTHDLFKKMGGETYSEEIKSDRLTMEQQKKMEEPSNWDDFHGGNFAITINTVSSGKLTPQFNLMILNSRRYLHIPEKVLAWMKAFVEQKNPVDTLLFYHVPNYEFHEIWESKLAIGIKKESVCFEFDRGRIHNFIKQIPQIKAVFVGHDHVNDYWGKKDGIYYIYGRKSSTYSYGGKKDYVPQDVKGVKIGFKYIHLIFQPAKKIELQSICGMRSTKAEGQSGTFNLEECKEVKHEPILL
jgi:hypothetical protein